MILRVDRSLVESTEDLKKQSTEVSKNLISLSHRVTRNEDENFSKKKKERNKTKMMKCSARRKHDEFGPKHAWTTGQDNHWVSNRKGNNGRDMAVSRRFRFSRKKGPRVIRVTRA